jgi:CRP/FNR family transcriptional regulator, cyclic AMP receptor protein
VPGGSQKWRYRDPAADCLAEMVGTTRSRVSFFMNRFRKMGLIDYNGSLQVRRALLTFLLQA